MITINSLYNSSMSFNLEKVQSSFTALQKKIYWVAFFSIVGLAAVLMAVRFLKSKSISNTPNSKNNSLNSIIDKTTNVVSPKNNHLNASITEVTNKIISPKIDAQNDPQKVSAKVISKKINQYGHTYEGEMVNNQLNGHGKITYVKNCVFISDEGEFENDYLVKGKKLGVYENLEGEFNKDKLHGQGKKVIKDGTIYEGQFKNHQLNGPGKITYPEKNLKTISEEGIFEDDCLIKGTKIYIKGAMESGEFEKETPTSFSRYVLKGKGKKIDDEGTEYEGIFSKGKLEGDGKITFKDGKIIQGNFHNGELFGKGTIIDSYKTRDGIFNGSRLTSGTITSKEDGSIIAGEFDWYEVLIKGKKIDKNGIVYEDGEYENGSMKKGRIVNQKGFTYDGEFENGSFKKGQKIDLKAGTTYEGTFGFLEQLSEGIKKDIDGTVYEGKFLSNQLSGKGKKTDKDGNIYEGDFYQDQLHDIQGKKTDKDGNVYQGEFRNGNSNTGTLTLLDGTIYSGKFDNKGMIYKGTKFDTDGTTYQGYFSKGKLDGVVLVTPNDDDKVCVAKYQHGVEKMRVLRYMAHNHADELGGYWNDSDFQIY